MHQQPLEAPLLPNRSSRAGQRSGVSGRTLNFMPPPPKNFLDVDGNSGDDHKQSESIEMRRAARGARSSRSYRVLRRRSVTYSTDRSQIVRAEQAFAKTNSILGRVASQYLGSFEHGAWRS